MKLEIELDLNQIDYDAINKQIQDKVAAMDLHEEYQISSKINYKIKEEVENQVDYYFRNGAWGGLNDNSKREIRDEISKDLKELVKPYVDNVFNQIPQEELNQIVSDLLPRVLMDILVSNMSSALTNCYYQSAETITQMCESRIKSMLGR